MTNGSLKVCADCFEDTSLKDLIESYADDTTCSFCGATSTEDIAAPIEDVVRHMRECIAREFDDAANWLPYESAEGGYQGTTWDTPELVTDKLGVSLPNDADGRLLAVICDGLGDQLWCERDPFGLSKNQKLQYSWDAFCRVIKHQRRFFFLDHGSSDGELYDPADVLATIFSYAQTIGLMSVIPQGTRLFRARHQPAGKKYETPLDLGPPPVKAARQSNRMSPPGIVMMYASEDAETALRETADKSGRYAIGEFVTERDAVIVDFSKLPPIPSLFHAVPDSLPYDPRELLIFLHQIEHDMSRPIARDDRVHVEYVPTQVVTEYLRTVGTSEGPKIHGVRYRSARHAGGSSIVLFADRSNLVLPKQLQDDFYHLKTDRWLRLDIRKDRTVTSKRLAVWAAEYQAMNPPWFWTDEDDE